MGDHPGRRGVGDGPVPAASGERGKEETSPCVDAGASVSPEGRACELQCCPRQSPDSLSTSVPEQKAARTLLPRYLSQMVSHPYQEPQAFAQPTQVRTCWPDFFAPLSCTLSPFAGVDRDKGVSPHISLAWGPQHSTSCRPPFGKPCGINSSRC